MVPCIYLIPMVCPLSLKPFQSLAMSPKVIDRFFVEEVKEAEGSAPIDPKRASTGNSNFSDRVSKELGQLWVPR